MVNDIPVDGSQAIGCTIREHAIQKSNLLFKGTVRFQLELRPLEVLARVEDVLDGVVAGEQLGHGDEVGDALQGGGGTASLEDEPLLGHEHRALAQDIGIHLSIPSH